MCKQGVWNRLNIAMAVNTLLNWKILMVLLQSMIRKADWKSTTADSEHFFLYKGLSDIKIRGDMGRGDMESSGRSMI